MGGMAESKMLKKYLNPDVGKVMKVSPCEEETHRFYTELWMVKKLISSGGRDQAVCNKVEPELKLVLNFSPSEERLPPMFRREEPLFKRKIGSLIPAKRRLVKRMMFDYIVNIITHVFCARRQSSHD